MKRFITFALALILTLSLAACGTLYKWPKIPAAHWKYENIPGGISLTGYLGSETQVKIPEEIDGILVTKIGDRAFKDNASIEELELPGSLEVIGNYAFQGCVNLRLMNDGWPGNATTIGEGAFYGCRLGRSTMPFLGDPAVEDWLRIHDSIKTIGDGAFFGSESMIYAESISAINPNAFLDVLA